MRKIIFRSMVCLCLLSFFMALGACQRTTQGGENDQTDPAALPATDASQYVIITPELASEDVTNAARALRAAIKETTGVLPEWRDDFFAPDDTKTELLIGNTNRELSQAANAEQLRVLDHSIIQSNGQIAIAAGSDAALQEAVDAFVSRYVFEEGIQIPMQEHYIYRHAYLIDRFLIHDIPIEHYTITVFENRLQADAEQLQTFIKEAVGYLPPIVKPTEGNSPTIAFYGAETAENIFFDPTEPLEAGWSTRNGQLCFVSGALATAAPAVKQFADLYLTRAEKTVNTEPDMEVILTMQSDRLFVADDKYLSDTQKLADNRKEAVSVATADLGGYHGTVYYVSNRGSDNNDGKTPQSAWATVDKVNSADLKAGDVILFERGGEWRGTGIKNGDPKADGSRYHFLKGVLFSNYGDTSLPLPIINGSERNYAEADLWHKTELVNVWRCTVPLKNVGVIVFDHSGAVGDCDAQYGKILFHKASDKTFYEKRDNLPLGAADLTDDLQFYSDLTNDTLYVYSAKGNPGERFTSIEIGVNDILLNLGGNGNAVDGLHFRFCGNTAVGGGAAKNAFVRNCVIEWIGGAVMSEEMLYGNGISFYGEVQDLTVENNWLCQIYDTGITFQISSRGEGSCRYKNICIRQNLVEYCHWGIEFYNQPREGCVRSTEAVLIEKNICRFGGMGYGTRYRFECYDVATVRNASAALLCSWGLTDDTRDFLIKNNVFEQSTGALGVVTLPNNAGDRLIRWESNTYIQTANASFGKLFSEFYEMDVSAERVAREILGDQNATVVYILEK